MSRHSNLSADIGTIRWSRLVVAVFASTFTPRQRTMMSLSARLAAGTSGTRAIARRNLIHRPSIGGCSAERKGAALAAEHAHIVGIVWRKSCLLVCESLFHLCVTIILTAALQNHHREVAGPEE
jgi:hypothetical protein